MTTRDDLVSRLRERITRLGSTPEKLLSFMNGINPLLEECASALEAKDAENARLATYLSNAEDQFQAKVGEVISQMDRISDLERLLAGERERCAALAKSHESTAEDREADSNVQWHDGNDSACERIAAAIRGGAK